MTGAISASAAGSSVPRRRVRREHQECVFGDAGEPVPDLLGDERDERVEEPQHPVQHVDEHRARGVTALGVRALQRGLGELDVPVAEGVPGELVEGRGGLGELEAAQRVVHLGRDPLGAREDPPVSHRQRSLAQRAVPGVEVPEVQQQEARGVPQLVVERLVPVDPIAARA